MQGKATQSHIPDASSLFNSYAPSPSAFSHTTSASGFYSESVTSSVSTHSNTPASQSNSLALFFQFSAKILWTASALKHTRASFSQEPSPWSDERQKHFETLVGWLTVSAGFPLNWVSNPEFISFCREFIPQAEVPSRYVLTNQIIPSALERIRAQNQIDASAGTGLGTAQCDG